VWNPCCAAPSEEAIEKQRGFAQLETCPEGQGERKTAGVRKTANASRRRNLL